MHITVCDNKSMKCHLRGFISLKSILQNVKNNVKKIVTGNNQSDTSSKSLRMGANNDILEIIKYKMVPETIATGNSQFLKATTNFDIIYCFIFYAQNRLRKCKVSCDIKKKAYQNANLTQICQTIRVFAHRGIQNNAVLF